MYDVKIDENLHVFVFVPVKDCSLVRRYVRRRRRIRLTF